MEHQILPSSEQSLEGWNNYRARQSPLWQASACQIERVKTIYQYVRNQYLIIFYKLWIQYRKYLGFYASQVTPDPDDYTIPWGYIVSTPAVFTDRGALLEWIDILCSRGLLFLKEILEMNDRDRRHFLVKTYHPTMNRSRILGDEDYMMKGIFRALNNRPAFDNNEIQWSDSIENVAGPNQAWVTFMTRHAQGAAPAIRPVDFCDEENKHNALRRIGYVFWNHSRCRQFGLDNNLALMDIYIEDPQAEPISWYGGRYYLDHPARIQLGQAEIELCAPSVPPDEVDLGETSSVPEYRKITWIQANNHFKTPILPEIVEFGILGDSWRIFLGPPSLTIYGVSVAEYGYDGKRVVKVDLDCPRRTFA